MEAANLMQPINAWDTIISQSPLFAFMAIVIYAGAKYIKEEKEKSDRREDARELRYNQLVDKSFAIQQEYINPLIDVVKSNTKVMERVERKLDGSE